MTRHHALLLVIALTVFSPVLFAGRTMYPTDITNQLILPFGSGRTAVHVQETALSDYVLYYFPVRYFQAVSFRSGQLNLWNPHVFGGHPSYANNASIVAFDPFNLLLLLPNLGSALAWRSFLQVVACMFSMYAYLRHLNLEPTACTIGSAGFGLNSMFWANIFDWSVAGMLWLPLVLLLVDRAVARPSFRRTGVAGLVLGIALLASPLQIYFYICLCLSALMGLKWLFLQRDRKSLGVACLVVGATLAIGMGMSAIQLVPSMELYSQSARFANGPVQATGKSTRTIGETAIATAGLASFVFPNLAGRLKDSMMVSGVLWGGETHWQGFIGVLPFFLAVLGGLAGTDKRRVPFAVLAISVVVLVLYTPLGPVLYERFFLIYIFCTCVLAAFGCTAALRGELNPVKARLAVKTLAGIGLAFVLVVAAANVALAISGEGIRARVATKVLATLPTNYFGRSFPELYVQKSQQFLDDLRIISPHTLLPLAFACAGLALIAWVIHGSPDIRRVAVVAVAITAADLSFMALTHVPLVDARRYPFLPGSPAIDLIRKDTGLFRVISVRAQREPPVLPLGLASTYGLDAADGNDDLGPPNVFQLISFAHEPCGSEVCVEPSNTELANVKYLLAGPHTVVPAERFDLIYDRDIRVFRSRTTFGRAFWASSYEVVPDTQSAIDRVRSASFNPRTNVILDRPPDVAPGQAVNPRHLSVVAHSALDVTIQVDAPEPGILVLGDTYYPGWRATIDGHPVGVLRANGVMRAVAVNAGAHTIQFEYSPLSLKLGAAMTLVALFAAAGMVCVREADRSGLATWAAVAERRS